MRQLIRFCYRRIIRSKSNLFIDENLHVSLLRKGEHVVALYICPTSDHFIWAWTDVDAFLSESDKLESMTSCIYRIMKVIGCHCRPIIYNLACAN